MIMEVGVNTIYDDKHPAARRAFLPRGSYIYSVTFGDTMSPLTSPPAWNALVEDLSVLAGVHRGHD
jgi:hypothetical protein